MSPRAPTVGVVDHGMGNLRSVGRALVRAGAEVEVSSDPKRLRTRAALCVPGQGVFGRCMDRVINTGLIDLIGEWVEAERPYLGICLGMQILFESSEEQGPRAGLGVVGGSVRKLPAGVTVPHIGWNTLDPSPYPDDYFYFDHSFAPYPSDDTIVRAWCEHGNRFAAWIERGSLTGVQFHPEKSGSVGLRLLEDWVAAA